MASLLLDTHALLWWLDGDLRLPAVARAAIADPQSRVFVSAATAWEITTKHRLGKLPGAAEVARDVSGCVAAQGFAELPITQHDAERAGPPARPAPRPVRPTIDRASAADVELVSNETLFDAYGVRRLW